MANLLSWNTGLGLQKKRDNNRLTPLMNSPQINSNVNRNASTNTNVTNNTVTSGNSTDRNNAVSNFRANNVLGRAQAVNDQIRQQAELRRQQEERRRQQIEQIQKEQEERQRQEQEKKQQQQQAEQQKQQRLLNSSLNGGNMLNNTSVGDRRSGIAQNSNRSVLGMLGAQNNLDRRLNPVKTESDKNYDRWLGTTSMENLSKEMDKARADNNTDWIRRIQQYSGKNTNDFDTYKKQAGAQNSELNLGRSAATTLRDVSDTKTYNNIDVNDSDNVRYFGRQNLLKKTLKSALGDNANVSNMSYQDVINTYNNASGDQQADIKKAIADEIVNQREYAKNGNEESLKSVSYLADLNALLNEYGTDKGKSFGKQLGDWLTTGGFVGNIGGNTLTEALGNVTGTEDSTKAYLEKQQNKRTDLGAVGAADTALTGVANTALNLGTGGWYGLANAGVNTANMAYGLDDKVLDFDEYGNASLRDKETGEKLAELGNTAINDLFAIAGKAGIGPGLGKGSLKDIAKYAWQEPLWAGGTTLAQEGFSNLGKGKEFGDYNWENVAKSFAANLGQDIGMDLFNLGRTRAQMKINSQGENNSLQNRLQQEENNGVRRLEDGTMVKTNADGSVSRLTDSELARVATEPDSRRVAQQTNGRVDNNMDGIIARVLDNNGDGIVDKRPKAKAGLEELRRMATGQNRLQYALADADGEASQTRSNRTTANDTDLIRSDIAHRNPDNTIGLDGEPRRWNKGSESLTEYRNKLADDIVKNHGTEDNIKVAGRRNKVGINANSAGKITSNGGPDVLDKRSELISDKFDYMKYAKKVGNEPDYKGKHDFANNWDEYITKNVKFSNGDVADVRNVIANNAEGKGNLYTADYNITKNGSSGKEPASGKSPSRYGASIKSNVPQNGENVNNNNSVTKLADLSYDVSDKVTGKAKKAAKKAADIANEHPLGGTTKFVDLSNAENNSANSEKIKQMTDDELSTSINKAGKVFSGWLKTEVIKEKQKTINPDFEFRPKGTDKPNWLSMSEYMKAFNIKDSKEIPYDIKQQLSTGKDANNIHYDTTFSGLAKANNMTTSQLKTAMSQYADKMQAARDNLNMQDVRSYLEKKGSNPLGISSFNGKKTTYTYDNAIDTIVEKYADVDPNTASSNGARNNNFSGDSGGERRKVMNLSRLEDPVKDALKSGQKMTTQEFFEASNIKSNDLAALKQNYPNEVESVKKLIKAGTTPETFNSKVFNKDGSLKSEFTGREIPPMRAMFELAYNYNKVTDAGSTKDQKRANIFGGETIKENTMAESSFAKNTSKNKAFSGQTRNKLAGDPVEYKPTTNEERLARANEILSTKSFDEVDNYLRDNYFNTTDKYRNSGDTVLAGEFAKMLDADGQYGRATEIINEMSKIATKQGQQIQALSIMANRSPEGIANMAQTAIKKGGGKVDGELRKQILSNTQDIGKIRAKMAELNTENGDISYKIMNGEGDLPALRKRQMEIAQEYRGCLDQEGRSFAELSETVNNNSPRDKSIFGSVWRASLLSGPRTHVGNAVSNTFQNALNAGADRIAAGLDWARTKITGGEREVVTSAGGRGKGLKRGLKAAGEVMKTGTNLWEGTEKVTSGQGANAWGYGGELEFKNKIADTMVAKPTNYVFRAMSAGDLPFRYSAFENAIRTEAKRQGMNQGYKGQALQDYINSRVATPDPDLQAYGIKKGNEAVYDSDTFLSKTMSNLDKQINKIDNKVGRNAAKTAKTLIAPFVKVPSKVLSTAVDYSPVGAVQAVVKKVGGSKNYSVGQFETDLAKSGLGSTAFVGLGYALSSAGLLTGGYPDEQKERDRWKTEGIEPNSVKIGDKYVSLNYLGPAAILMGMGAGVQQRQEKGQDPFTISVGAISDTFNAFLEQSYVQGLNSAINAAKDSQRYGESYANSLARGVVPNLLRQTAVATDDKQRQVDNPLEAITSGIPGLSQTLDAKVDVYGREIENKQTLPLGQMWDALKISNSRETNAVIDEVSRLHNVNPSNKDLQVTPPQAQSSVSVDGVNVKLTDNQKSQLQKDIGAAALEGMQQVMNSLQYQDLSDEEKASALNKAREDAQKQVRRQFIETNNITADNNPGTQESGGSATGNFANKAITSATANTEGKNAIVANSSLDKSSKDVIDKYNSMTKEEWENYLYGSSAEAAAAEYNLAKAKYENSLANNELNDAQKVKKEKELRKLSVSKDWEKKYRDAYGLAGSKADMQEYLNGLDDETRRTTVGILNGLNRAMYEAGVIQASTYKTRSNAINGTTTAKSSSGRKKSSSGKSGDSSDGLSSAEASALASLAKTMVRNTNTTKVQTTKAPETQRKMTNTRSSMNKTKLATYTAPTKKIRVTKGTKRSVG